MSSNELMEIKMPTAKEINATIQAHCDTLSNHDKEGWLALWADDTVLEDPVGVDTYRGIEGLRTSFWKLVDDLSPMKLWLERDVIVCGNEAIAILQGVVTREGAMQHVGPLVDHFTFNDEGKITMMRAFWKYD
ncbi:nuclear transport factor 2 family protein [Mycobacterium sp.]|uniref:nuclear transport factor 2 family protein n=1 Tax=Mycobacterium sp. TaxID=1785 RepID=UPI003BB20681